MVCGAQPGISQELPDNWGLDSTRVERRLQRVRRADVTATPATHHGRHLEPYAAVSHAADSGISFLCVLEDLCLATYSLDGERRCGQE